MDFKTWLLKNGVDEVVKDFFKTSSIVKTQNIHYYWLRINNMDYMLSTCVQFTIQGRITGYVLGNYYPLNDTNDSMFYFGSSRNQLKEKLKYLKITRFES